MPTQPLKILHINSEKTWRGGEQQVAYLIDYLHANGHRNILAAPPGSELLARIDPARALPFPLRQTNDLDLFSILKLARFIRKQKPDLIHAHTARAHAIGTLAKSISRLSIPFVASRRVQFPIKQTAWNRYKYSKPDLYIAISKASAQTLIDAGINPGKIQIIYSGVDPRRFEGAKGDRIREKFGLEPDSFVIGHVGACDEKKGQRTIITAASQLLDTRNDLHFFIVGDGPLREGLIQQTRELGIDRHVHLPGFRNDLGDFYDLFDLFLMPSLEEGLCTAIIEAQLMTTPVVASNAGGIPEVIENGINGLLIPPADANALAGTIEKLIGNPTLRHALGQAGYERAYNRFLAERMAKNTLNAYSSLLADFKPMER